MKLLKVFPLFIICMLFGTIAEGRGNPLHLKGDPFHLYDLITASVDRSLTLAECDARIQKKLCECRQAGVLYNPALSIEVEGIGAKRNCRNRGAFDQLQVSLGVTQLLELGNKRTARQQAVATEAAILLMEREAAMHQLIQNATKAYANYTYLKEKAVLHALIEENHLEKLQCQLELLRNGKIRLIDQKKCSLECQNAKIEKCRAEQLICGASQRLQFLTDKSCSEENISTDSFYNIDPPESLCNYLERLDYAPELVQLQCRQTACYYRYLLEKANGVPDLSLTAGVERDSNPTQYSLFFQVGFILPIFNCNRDNIDAACWDQVAAESSYESRRKELEGRCHELHESWQRLQENVSMLKEELLPAANELVELHQQLYQEQKINCLELLDARHQLYSIQMQYIEALHDLHEQKAELHAICGIAPTSNTDPCYGEF